MTWLRRAFRRLPRAAVALGRPRPVKVGWLTVEAKSSVIYFPPERIRSADTDRTHAKSAARCPAIIGMESRYFMIRCPFDLRLRFSRTEDGAPSVVNALGAASPVRRAKLAELVMMTSESEWRYPDRPTIQITLPYLFIADDPVYLTQTDAFMDYRETQLPGTIFGGRFPIHIWPRPLMWAFEWREPEKDLLLRRGDPWFYVQFETNAPEQAVQLVEAERTAALTTYVEEIGGAVNYVNQTFSLFSEARRRRPDRLLVPKRR